MNEHPVLPWLTILDYLAEIGSIRNFNEFGYQSLKRLHKLIPFDVNGVYVAQNYAGEIGVRAQIADYSKWTEFYNNYYWKLKPDSELVVDWRDWRHTEYVTDFIEPQGICYAAGIPFYDSNFNFIGGLGLHRSKTSPNFNEKERRILELILPHLSNYYAMHSLIALYDAELPDSEILTSIFPCLTKREAEIAALICRNFRTGMIATKLLISRLTVYRHIANIFEKFNVLNRDELVEKLLSNYRGKVDWKK